MLREGILFSPLQEYLHAVDFEDAGGAELSDFVAVEEFHAARAFVEVVAEGDAAVPVLDFSVSRPEGEVERFWGGEEFAEGGDMNFVHNSSEE